MRAVAPNYHQILNNYDQLDHVQVMMVIIDARVPDTIDAFRINLVSITMTNSESTTYGVKYSIDKYFVAPDLYHLKKWHNVKYVRLTWLDLHNVTRCRVLSISYFERLLETASGRPGVSVVGCVLGLIGLKIADGFSAAGSYLYVADLTSMRLCPYAPGHAMLFGWFHNTQVNVNPGKSLEYDLCPRTLLARQIS